MRLKTKCGVLIATRGFFNPSLASSGRRQLLDALERSGIEPVILPEDATGNGAVESMEDARKYVRLFDEHRREIDGVIVSLPNFGDELGIVNALHESALNVPVLVQAFDDTLGQESVAERRDSFCGKLSVCNNLVQYGIPFTTTASHTCAVDGAEFAADLDRFARVCRVVGGLRKARIGAIGARPAAFQTVRASEKLLQRDGITVVPVDLSEILSAAEKLKASDGAVKDAVAEVKAYGTIASSTPAENVLRHSRLSVAINHWVLQNDIHALAVQCWTSVEQNYGCATCATMSMLGNRLVPSACELDIGGAVGMYALTLASGNASALMDWNNNYGEDRDKCMCTHCSNFPRDFMGGSVEISNLDVLGASLGPERCFGAIKGKVAPGPMSFFRVMTDEVNGRIRAYLGEGEFTADPTSMDGGIAVCRIPNLQKLLQYMCRNGFPHHGSFVRSHCAGIVEEAVTTYLGWDLYRNS